MPTANMSLTLPTDHGSDDVWDTLLDAVFALVDAHDHTTGKGVKIPANALNINADVSWSASGTYYAITDLKVLDFQPRPASGMTSYAGALFVSSADNELYWRTTSGTNVKVTAGAALNVTAFTGGIGGDYAAVNALFSFDDATDRYLAQQQGSPRPWAGIAHGNLDLYEQAASIVNRVRQKSPAALAASYDVTWFAAVPAGTSLVQIAHDGTLTATNALPSDTGIALSGTGGYITHANRSRTVQLYASLATCSAGTVTATGGIPGGVVNASTTAYIPLGHWNDIDRLKSFSIQKAATGADATVSVVTTDAGGSWTAVSGATGTMANGASGTLVLTPTGGNFTPALGASVWLKIVTVGGGSVTFVSGVLTTDVV